MSEADKTVYVLGAGFSSSAGFPLQGEILDRIRTTAASKAMAGSPEEEFGRSRRRLLDFIDRVFTSRATPPLEDVFTLLDHAIAKREYAAGESWTHLEDVRQSLSRGLLYMINQCLSTAGKPALTFYRRVASHFLDARVDARQEGDLFSLVLLNWDSLFESCIYWCLAQTNGLRRADVDYCCYTTPLDGSPHTPSLQQKAKGLYNIKVVKLHGSTNWLICPNCNRMYTGLGSPSELQHKYLVGQFCQSCPPRAGQHLETPLGGIPLSPFLVTPTYLKVFDNPHIQMTWHNAYVELAEAEHVVFIGYSMPEADYHFRTLLRRAIDPDARITVVLTNRDKPPRNCPSRARRAYATERYLDFFGERVTFYLRGARDYFNAIIGRQGLEIRLRGLRRRFPQLKIAAR